MASALREFTLGSMKDPGLAGLKSSIRLPIAVAIASALVLPLGSEQAIMFAFVGSFVPAATSKGFTGPWWSRLGGWIGVALVLSVAVVLMSHLSESPVLGTLFLLLLAFIVSLGARISGFANVLKLPLIDGTTVALLVPAEGEVNDRVLGLCVGVGVLAVLSLIFDRDKLQLHSRIADALDALAQAIETGHVPGGTTSNLKRSLESLPAPVGGSRRLSALAGLVRSVEIQEQFVQRAGPDVHGSDFATQLAALDRQCAQALRRQGDAPAESDAKAALDNCIAELSASVSAGLANASISDAEVADRADQLVTRQDAALNGLIIVSLTRRSLGLASSPPSDIGQARELQSEPSRPAILGATITSMFSPQSAAMREALRAVIAVGLAAVVAYAFPLEHGYWVVLTTLVVLSVNAGGTFVMAIVQIVGAYVGLILSVFLTQFINTTPLAIIGMLVALFLFLYSERVLGLGLAMVWLTVAMVMMLSISSPGTWEVGTERPLDVLLGSVVGVVAGLLLWPSGVGRVLNSALAEAFRSISAVSGSMARRLLDGQQPEQFNNPSWRAAFGATERSIDGLSSYLMQAGRKAIPDGVYIDLVDRVTWQMYTAVAVHRFVSPVVDGQPLSAALVTEQDALEQTYRRIADGLDEGRVSTEVTTAATLVLPAPAQAEAFVHRVRAGQLNEQHKQELLDVAALRHWIGDQASVANGIELSLDQANGRS